MSQGDVLKKIFSQNKKTLTDYAKFIGKHKSNVSKRIKEGNFDDDYILSFSDFLKIPFDELKQQLQYEPEQSDYVKKLEEERELLLEIRDGLKRENAKNEEIIKARDEEIARLKSQANN